MSIDTLIFIKQNVYQPGKPGNREVQKSGKTQEIAGNFVIGQEIFIVFIDNTIL
jgi:hypothetical protein